MYVSPRLSRDWVSGLEGRSRLPCGVYGVRMGIELELTVGRAMASPVLRRGRPYELAAVLVLVRAADVDVVGA
jgi:hypothetical protein